jgi:signal transduction histidine kinase
VEVGEIVEAALSRFGDALERHTLAVDPPPKAAVDVDPAQLTEALGHGLENAASYSPPGTPIHVSVEAGATSVVLRVSDRGAGVPAGERDRVFERFVRLPEAATVPGTGLGLSIARSLVEMNGGRLRLGEARGGGTVFEIELERSDR